MAMSERHNERMRIKEEINSKIPDSTDAFGPWVEVWEDRASLDGWFTPSELRQIADLIEEFDKRIKDLDGD